MVRRSALSSLSYSLLLGLLLLAAAGPALLGKAALGAGEDDDELVAFLSEALVLGDGMEFEAAVEHLSERGQPDVVAAAILGLRYRGLGSTALKTMLTDLTGHEAYDWHDWMLWQQAHPKIVPHPSFRHLKVKVLGLIDPDYLQLFADPWTKPDAMKIRMEEIAWGGVPALDGIPSLDTPAMIPAGEADYLWDSDLVFGVEIAGDARAYPLRILGWHEMMNDVIGGVPVALAYCTLCGAGILFETQIEGRAEPFIFGSSGLLYRSNKLMFDWETKSLWNQFTGEPVVGPLTLRDIALPLRPLATTTWQRWREAHPNTTVLSLETGHRRDYGSGVVYADYFASPALMFPALVDPDSLLAPKDIIFGMRGPNAAKAWPLAAFEGGAVINDLLGKEKVVLIGETDAQEVRAYARDDRDFAKEEAGLTAIVDSEGAPWQVTEEALVGPAGQRLARLPGHIAYWFAWDSYMGVASELWQPGD